MTGDLAQLSLSVRAMCALDKAGFTTVEQLVACRYGNLLRHLVQVTAGHGARRVTDEVVVALACEGLELQGRPADGLWRIQKWPNWTTRAQDINQQARKRFQEARRAPQPTPEAP